MQKVELLSKKPYRIFEGFLFGVIFFWLLNLLSGVLVNQIDKWEDKCGRAYFLSLPKPLDCIPYSSYFPENSCNQEQMKLFSTQDTDGSIYKGYIEKCAPTSRTLVKSYLYALINGPAFLLEVFLPAKIIISTGMLLTFKHLPIISSIIFAIIGALCFWPSTLKKGIIRFITIYLLLTLPVSFLFIILAAWG
ncbi:MAG: hypothetical protein WBV22_03990 [Anaerolineaceae bacterium]